MRGGAARVAGAPGAGGARGARGAGGGAGRAARGGGRAGRGGRAGGRRGVGSCRRRRSSPSGRRRAGRRRAAAGGRAARGRAGVVRWPAGRGRRVAVAAAGGGRRRCPVPARAGRAPWRRAGRGLSAGRLAGGAARRRARRWPPRLGRSRRARGPSLRPRRPGPGRPSRAPPSAPLRPAGGARLRGSTLEGAHNSPARAGEPAAPPWGGRARAAPAECTMMRGMRSLLAVGIGLAGFAFGAVSWATPPGANGLIVYVREVGSDREIYTVQPDGSGLRVISAESGGTDPDWSPDGRSIVATLETAVWAVHLMDADGLNPRPVMQTASGRIRLSRRTVPRSHSPAVGFGSWAWTARASGGWCGEDAISTSARTFRLTADDHVRPTRRPPGASKG